MTNEAVCASVTNDAVDANDAVVANEADTALSTYEAVCAFAT